MGGEPETAASLKVDRNASLCSARPAIIVSRQGGYPGRAGV